MGALDFRFVRTPIEAFNLISGGGFRLSTLVEAWGEPKAGKSVFCYQVGGLFVEDYPKGKILFLDAEQSGDQIRLIYAFGWPSDWYDIDVDSLGNFDKIPKERILVAPSSTIEKGFGVIKHVIDLLFTDNDFNEPLLIIWDSISVCPTEKGVEGSDRFAGGQGDRPQVMKFYLRQMMSKVYRKPIVVLLPNQVYTTMPRGPYAAAQIKSGEGFGLKHDVQYSLHFDTEKDYYIDVKEDTKKSEDSKPKDTIKELEYSLKRISTTKSKFCPSIRNLPVYISGRSGGVIDSNYSLLLAGIEYGLIEQNKGWYTVPGSEKKVRFDELLKDAVLIKNIKASLLNYFKEKFVLVKILYQLKNGETVLKS
jgi:hypothetical protein